MGRLGIVGINSVAVLQLSSSSLRRSILDTSAFSAVTSWLRSTGRGLFHVHIQLPGPPFSGFCDVCITVAVASRVWPTVLRHLLSHLCSAACLQDEGACFHLAAVRRRNADPDRGRRSRPARPLRHQLDRCEGRYSLYEGQALHATIGRVAAPELRVVVVAWGSHDHNGDNQAGYFSQK